MRRKRKHTQISFLLYSNSDVKSYIAVFVDASIFFLFFILFIIWINLLWNSLISERIHLVIFPVPIFIIVWNNTWRWSWKIFGWKYSQWSAQCSFRIYKYSVVSVLYYSLAVLFSYLSEKAVKPIKIVRKWEHLIK